MSERNDQGPTTATPEQRPCGGYFFAGTYVAGRLYCDGKSHIIGENERRGIVPAGESRFCPSWVEGEVRYRVMTDAKDLGGLIQSVVDGLRADDSGWEPLKSGVIPVPGGGFLGRESYDPKRNESAARAWSSTMEFCTRPSPSGKLLLVGGSGQGKTMLLLLAHFHRLVQGTSSRFVTTPQLRRLFRSATSFDTDTAEEARARLDEIKQARQVCADDLGNVAGDQRSRGEFAEGLKDLLSSSKGAWMVTTNLSSEQGAEHADLGWQNLSRLLLGATVVKMDGTDWRAATAKSA